MSFICIGSPGDEKVFFEVKFEFSVPENPQKPPFHRHFDVSSIRRHENAMFS